ncbi:protein SPT2 homolog [Teleopsis dalmanni]|uniref:protein SPT2 homolog n=1 Tax=Teleopsis dalmanni TaxID=139649 RepID=UPI0018CF76E1|nr:protein SPT2 homolog [Teleopsis dalmanni]
METSAKMDFCALLSVAKKNSQNDQKNVKYYSTKFAPPKKESKEAKKLSENIQKFLKKREAEEEQRKKEKQRDLQNLLAMRDEKSKNKIKKMLKVTKSANKSVLDDAVNTEHTAVTMQGPDQPDQDDYGYVSHTANAFYHNYIEKVKDVKEDKSFQSASRPQSLKDLTGTKERVKEAINRETEDKKGLTRHRTTSSVASLDSQDSNKINGRISSSSKSLYDPEAERREEERKKREEEQKKIKNRKPLPPPMDFQALLKLAEKKQHEPIKLLPQIKKKEPERLLTSKEKQELEERKKAKERFEKSQSHGSGANKDRKEATPRMESNGRIPKLNQSSKPSNASASNKVTLTTNKMSNSSTNKSAAQQKTSKPGPAPSSTSAQSLSINNNKPIISTNSKQTSSLTKKPYQSNVPTSGGKTSAKDLQPATNTASKKPYSGPTREFPPRDNSAIKPRQFPSPVQKTRQFPPADVRRSTSAKTKPQALKRRIIDDDDEDEYDSEMDDFIDDGDCEDDYSSQIRAIFGYDKSKYKDEDFDDAAMESNYAQVQREEYISKKIGIQEDLEDMRQEALEKKRKMMKKRKL